MTVIKDKILGILAHPKEAKAWAEGKKIEQYVNDFWFIQPNPTFDFDKNYRIKPEVHTATRWVNIYKAGPGGSLHISEEEANRWVASRVVDCVAVTITWTEGEGLED